MSNLSGPIHVSFTHSLSRIDPQQWNRLAGETSPFLRHEFLLALEQSGCVGGTSGWQPGHLIVGETHDNLLAAVPLYEKTNSYGEYVFDWSWADAWQTHGFAYYPKLVTAVPFTPSTGNRLLVAPGTDVAGILPTIIEAIRQRAVAQQASSWHVLFPTPEQKDLLQAAGLQSRLGCQFHWFNPGFASFEDFLGTLNSRRRKNLRKERAAVSAQHISFQWRPGLAITDDEWVRFHTFYQNTYLARGRRGYLNLEFFQRLGAAMGERLLLLFAYRDGEPVAGALFFLGTDTLFGRYWGCAEEFQFLHFETCFYQGIDYCIRHGLRRFDAGAQGEHKLQRGFRPVATWSSHWIAEPAFVPAITDFLRREEQHIRAYMQEAENILPFRRPASADVPDDAETPAHPA